MAKFRKVNGGSRPEVSDSSVEYAGIEINTPENSLLGYTAFIYGAPKIGKTTTALSWPKPIVLACEVRGIKAFTVPTIKCRSWQHVLKAIDTLSSPSNTRKYSTLIIDTVDLMHKYCLSYCCEKYGFDHPSDQGWGKGWERLSDEFLAQILRLFDLGYTLIFISHAKTTEVTSDFETYTRIDPTLAGTGRRVLLPLVDVIFYMKAKETRSGKVVRTITTKATREYEAGDRTQHLTDIELVIPAERKNSAYAILNARYKKNSEDSK